MHPAESFIVFFRQCLIKIKFQTKTLKITHKYPRRAINTLPRSNFNAGITNTDIFKRGLG
jgi:hypothetical protein